jgi:hypothetical protein
MKKKISCILMILYIGLTNAQVYINVEEENEESSAILQIDAENKGITFPHVFLTSISSYAPIEQIPAEGLIVYNPNLTKEIQPGYYYWKSTPTPHWERLGGVNDKGTIIQNIDIEFLGYNPTGNGSSAPSTFSVNGASATKQRCVKWNVADGGNDHTYCSYTINNGRNFNDTFQAIKNINGYMVTIVSKKEWDFVMNNVINDGKGLGGTNLNQAIWLGYVKFATPGNLTHKYHWITNESWENNWSNNATVQHNFDTDQPDSAASNTDSVCTYIQTSSSSSRLWRSQACTTTTNMTNLIVEFNQ